MKKIIFSFLIVLSFSFQTIHAQRNIIKALASGSNNKKCKMLIDWTAPLPSEYGERRSYYGNVVYSRSLPLFSDTYFKPHFGKKYEEMSSRDLQKYVKAFNNCYRNQKYRSQINAIGEIRTILYAFQPNANTQWLQSNIVKDLKVYTTQLENFKQMKDYLTLDDTKLTSQEIQNITSKIRKPGRNRYRTISMTGFNYLWPSQIEELNRLTEEKSKIAIANDVKIKVKNLISKPNNINTLRSIANYKNATELRNLTNYSLKSEYMNQLKTKENLILKGLMVTENQKLNQISKTIDGIDQVNYWLNNFNNNYSIYNSNIDVSNTKNIALKNRNALLSNHKTKILASINNSNSYNTLNQIKAKYLSKSSVYPVLNNAYTKKKQQIANQIEKEKQRLVFEEKRKQYALLTEKTATGEPTEYQIRFAYEFQLDAKHKQNQKDRDFITNAGDKNYQQIMTLFTSFVPNPKVKIKNFKKLACQKSTKPGYDCDFSSVNATNTGYFGTLNSGNDTKTARLVFVDDGYWQIVQFY